MQVGQPVAGSAGHDRLRDAGLPTIRRHAGHPRALGWIPHVAVGLLALPFILNQNSWFEWGNALWLLELQAAHVQAHGTPTFFIHAAGAYFYPQQLFYAGPLISVLAYPSVISGAWPVFAAVTAGAFMAASAGISWTARNLGVPARLAVIPGVLFACTPYIVSNLYGRGDWAELVGTGALAVAVGAATSLLTARTRSVPASVAALALAVATIAGVHNLTLLFSALVSPLLAVAVLPLITASRPQIVRRYGLVIGGAILGLAIDAIFLVPNVWLAGRTITSHDSASLLTQVTGFDRLGTILNPLPIQPSGTTGSDVHTQTLALAIAWVVIAAVWLGVRHRLPRRPAITVGLLVLSGAFLGVLISHPSWWLSFPPTLRAIQFTFRLVTYVSLVVVMGVAVLLSVPAVRGSRVAVAALVAVTAWQVGVAGYLSVKAQARPAGTDTTSASVRATTTPAAYQSFQQLSFRMFVDQPVLAPRAVASVRPVGDDTPASVQLYGSQPAGTFVSTAIVGSPLIRVSGDVSISGVTANDLVVLYVNHSPWRATVSPVCNSCIGALSGGEPKPLLAGRLLTLVGVVGLGALAVLAWRGRQRRTRTAPTASA